MKDLNSQSASYFFDGIRVGDRVLIARAITLLESTSPTQRDLGLQILQLCLPFSGNSIRIGITGAPGVGKSSLIESLGNHIVAKGHQLAVLAVDPSSKQTKGSILGDKTRMQELAKHTGVFIRPTASGEHLGGVAAATRETMVILEAAGFDTLLVETVGVGQSETAVHGMTDLFILLLIAGAGDELQGIKRGIMEMADMVLINKADGENLQRSQITKSEVAGALHLFQAKPSGWTTSVELCSALTGSGIEALWQNIIKYKEQVINSGYFSTNRIAQHTQWFHENLQHALIAHFLKNSAYGETVELYQQKVKNGEMPAPIAVRELLSQILPG